MLCLVGLRPNFPKNEKIKLTINKSRQNIFTPLNFLNDLSKFIKKNN